MPKTVKRTGKRVAKKPPKRITSAEVYVHETGEGWYWRAGKLGDAVDVMGPPGMAHCPSCDRAKAHARRTLARLGITDVTFKEV